MARNADLFKAVAAHIRKNKRQYDQGVYGTITDCGTTCCIAGWATVLSGRAEVKVRKSPWGPFFVFRNKWRHEVDPFFTARKELGLTIGEAEQLFAASWKPAPGLTVPKALEKLAKGADLNSVSARAW